MQWRHKRLDQPFGAEGRQQVAFGPRPDMGNHLGRRDAAHASGHRQRQAARKAQDQPGRELVAGTGGMSAGGTLTTKPAAPGNTPK